MLWFRAPEKVYFKKGCLPVALNELKTVMGKKRVFIVTDQFLYKNGYTKCVTDKLDEMGIVHTTFYDVAPDPTLACAQEGAKAMRLFEPDCIIAIGGGSVMDASKGIAFAYYNDAPIFDYIYGCRQGGQALPILLIATTAGTGSEGNWTAVFTDTDHVKKGFALPALYPKESIVDPELMTTLSSRGIAGAASTRWPTPSNRSSPSAPTRSAAVFASGNPLAE